MQPAVNRNVNQPLGISDAHGGSNAAKTGYSRQMGH
jgi:hypothetical protein